MLHCIVDDDDNENTEMKLYLCRRFIEEFEANTDTETETESELDDETDSDFESDEEGIHNFVRKLGKIKILKLIKSK